MSDIIYFQQDGTDVEITGTMDANLFLGGSANSSSNPAYVSITNTPTVSLSSSSLTALETISLSTATLNALENITVTLSGSSEVDLASGAEVSLSSSTLSALENTTVSISGVPTVSLSSTTLTALENITVSGTVSLSSSTLSSLETISVGNTVSVNETDPFGLVNGEGSGRSGSSLLDNFGTTRQALVTVGADHVIQYVAIAITANTANQDIIIEWRHDSTSDYHVRFRDVITMSAVGDVAHIQCPTQTYGTSGLYLVVSTSTGTADARTFYHTWRN
jgi:hypothetical protein